jgi:hypothetical protein
LPHPQMRTFQSFRYSRMKRVTLSFITQNRPNPLSLPGFAIRFSESEHDPNVQIDPVVLKPLNAQGSQFCSGTNGFLIPSIAGTPGQSGSFTCSSPGRFTEDQLTTNWDRDFHGKIEKIAVRFFFSNSGSLRPFGAGGLTTTLGAGQQNGSDSSAGCASVHALRKHVLDAHVFKREGQPTDFWPCASTIPTRMRRSSRPPI